MKRGTPNHPKIPDLAGRLKIPPFAAVGMLECLWHWTAQFAMDGGIGKWSNYAIAGAIHGYTGDPDELIEALIDSNWIDKSDNDSVRLLVHDWPEHCEDAVHRALARKCEYFADGSRPNLARLDKNEREKIEVLYLQKEQQVKPRAPNVRTECAQSAPVVRPALADADALADAYADADTDTPPGPVSDSAGNSASSHKAPLSGVGLDCATSDEHNMSREMTAPRPRKRDTGHSRPIHGNNTDKSNLLTTQKRESSRNGEQKREPTAVGAVLPATVPKPGFDPGEFRARTVAEQADEIAALTGEPHWRDWWLAVCGRLFDSDGGWGVLCEHVDHVRNCADPDVRRRKDLGVLDDPAGYLVKRVTAWMKEHRLRWPAFPAKERAS